MGVAGKGGWMGTGRGHRPWWAGLAVLVELISTVKLGADRQSSRVIEPPIPTSSVGGRGTRQPEPGAARLDSTVVGLRVCSGVSPIHHSSPSVLSG
ncbi:hypothetical protein F5B21DRAFT_476179 [Xylaria acuta]|nr:hypothetical protein F5B21DRAFT_476179 [Xylaria acuta]